MSIGWTDINPVLIEVFTECALDRGQLTDGFKAEWSERQRSFTNPNQNLSLLLRITRVAGLGHDETRRSELTVGPVTTVTETQTGQRKVTLQVQAVVPENVDSQWAMASLERVRMRLHKPSIQERLLAVEVDLIEVRDAVALTYKDHGRQLSAATMDVVLGAVANEDDPITAGWIQYLVISSHLQNNDGALLPAGQQMVNVEVPDIP